MFSLICVWINGWVNNRKAGDLRRYGAHYDVIVMSSIMTLCCTQAVQTYISLTAVIYHRLADLSEGQGWGLLSQFSPFRYFPHFPLLSKQTLAIEYHVYIWQVSPQLSCGDTCQIWMWFRESNRYFCKIENLAYGEISERSFSNPHPRIDIPASVWHQANHWFSEVRR